MQLGYFIKNYQEKVLQDRTMNKEEYFSYHKSFSLFFYNPYFIRKPLGGNRRVEAPHFALKSVQKRLLTELSKFPVHDAVYGLDKKDYIENAKQHLDSDEILKIDLENFYKNCTLQKFRQLVKNSELLNLIEKYSLYLFYAPAEITSREEAHLPTGSPLSPLLSNLILNELDNNLYQIAQSAEGVYTRYLDDMNFSFSYKIPDDYKLWFKNHILNRITQDGWRYNYSKSKWLNENQDQIVITGIDIRKSPKVNNNYIKKILRPGLNKVAIDLVSGQPHDHAHYILSKPQHSILKTVLEQGGYQTLAGQVNYINQVCPSQFILLEKYFLKRINRAIELSPDSYKKEYGLNGIIKP